MAPRGIIIAAPRSGSGKTTITLGIIAALRARGLKVRAAKSGPDYIDPGFHHAATGQASLNLDSWAMPPTLLDSLIAHQDSSVAPDDVLIIESAMGLFDGAPTAMGQRGNAADLAARYGLPVVLVLDVSGQSQSAAAVARGFATHHPDVHIAGVILNRVGSPRHQAQITQAMTEYGLKVLGALTRTQALDLPERHLGLVQAQEQDQLAHVLTLLCRLITDHFDLESLLDVARPALLPTTSSAIALAPPGQRIALAKDAAFSFMYDHIEQGWRRMGAECVTFSPLADEVPPQGCDCCWLPGGYPELHAAALAAAMRFKSGLARFAATRPVYGECGGYMVLGETLEDAQGTRHPMAGLLSHSTSYAKRRLHLGYRDATLLTDSALGQAGTTLRGHEFHYASITESGNDTPLARLYDATGQDLGAQGGRRGPVSGGFFHVIATTSPEPLLPISPGHSA